MKEMIKTIGFIDVYKIGSRFDGRALFYLMDLRYFGGAIVGYSEESARS